MSETIENGRLHSGFVRSARAFPDRPAVSVGGEELTYAELYRRAASLAAILVHEAPSNEPPLTAVFGARSTAAFAGVLAALFRGHGYVPLNPAFPPERTRFMLDRSSCTAVIVDSGAADPLEQVLEGHAGGLTLLFADATDVSSLADRFSTHNVLPYEQHKDAEALDPRGDIDAIAYLLFTSGSTGHPKGVMVSHRNVGRFLAVMQERYALTETDRLSHMFDMVFDLSLFDMFMTWQAGACLCCPSRGQVLLPAAYVTDAAVSIWFSVPSVGVLLNRFGALTPNAFPNLRLSLFCGEALPAEVASAWQSAAPNSVVENLYGPTELTLACTLYRWDDQRSPAECRDGIVPIGDAYPGMDALVVDEALAEVVPGEIGELLMAGPQVALGYWKDPAKTDTAFVRLPGRDDVYYRTGDLVRRPTESEPLVYVGRLDHQVKIHGSRVELGEIEAVLREAAGVERTVAVGWPLNTTGGAEAVIGFLEADEADIDAVLGAAKTRLPGYMVPRELRLIPEFPLNSNGKVDRPALVRLLAE